MQALQPYVAELASIGFLPCTLNSDIVVLGTGSFNDSLVLGSYVSTCARIKGLRINIVSVANPVMDTRSDRQPLASLTLETSKTGPRSGAALLCNQRLFNLPYPGYAMPNLQKPRLK